MSTYVESIVQEMKDILEKNINFHLKNAHNKIYIEVVKDWDWLHDSEKDWKWWWWSNNPWWNGNHCKECIRIWEENDMEIDPLDEQRRYYLNK